MFNEDLPFSQTLNPVGDGERPWFAYYPPGVPTTISVPEPHSIPQMVSQAATKFGDRTAFSNFGATLSFAQVDQLANQFAAFLIHDLGLEAGQRIVLQMPNVLQYPVAMFGAFRAGLIVVNANPLYTPSEMREVFEDAQPVAIVVLANFAHKVEEVLQGSSIKHTIVTQVGDLLPQPKRTVMNLGAKYLKKMVPTYRLPNEIKFRDALKRGLGKTAPDPN